MQRYRSWVKLGVKNKLIPKSNYLEMFNDTSNLFPTRLIKIFKECTSRKNAFVVFVKYPRFAANV